MENKEQEKPEASQDEAPSLKTNATREAFFDQFEKNHFVQEDSTESDTSEEPAVTEVHSDSSSVKEEVKGGTKSEEQEAKASELIQNKEKALHEEREKRKQANLKLRELQKLYEEEKRIREEKLAALETKLREVVSSKPTDTTENTEDPVRRELAELKAEQRKEQEKRRQSEMEVQQKKLLDQINVTDKELKDEGFPGFRWAVNEVDSTLKTLIEEGEYSDDEYLSPAVWKEVYKSKVYEKVASEFKPLAKKEAIQAKVEKKKAASKAAVYPGAKPTIDVEEGEDTEIDSMDDYLKFKNKTSPRRNV